MNAPSDEEMKVRIGQSKPYTMVILKKTAKFADESSQEIVWEHEQISKLG